jgi:hypothetical protein
MTVSRILIVVTSLAFSLGFFASDASAQASAFTFNKKRWRNSARYRYAVSKEKEFFKQLMGRTKQEIVDVLGYPDVTDISRPDEFTYCLAREKVLVFNDEIQKHLCCQCIGNSIFLYFSDERVADIILAHAE